MTKLIARSRKLIAMRDAGPERLPATSYQLQAGFTLIEIIVAVGLFSVVMLISTGALLTLVAANRKAQATQSVMNNLNIALDGMVRAVREGTTYHCGPSAPITSALNCTSNVGPTGGDTSFAFRPFSPVHDTDRTIYFFQNGSLYKQEYINGAYQAAIALTAQEVAISTMRFYVTGATAGDDYQPRVVIVIKGTVGTGDIKSRSSFNIQATAVQRMLDL